MEENTVYAESGTIKISEEVVQTIAAMAVAEVKGVTLSASLTDGIVEKFVKKSYNKTVRIEMAEKEVSIELHVMVDYGVKIQATASELQDAVKRSIETMTDLTVTHVDVYVEGINTPKDQKKAEAPITAE